MSSSGFPRAEYFMEGRLSAPGRTMDVGVGGARSTAGSTDALRPMSGCVSEGMDMVGWRLGSEAAKDEYGRFSRAGWGQPGERKMEAEAEEGVSSGVDSE